MNMKGKILLLVASNLTSFVVTIMIVLRYHGNDDGIFERVRLQSDETVLRYYESDDRIFERGGRRRRLHRDEQCCECTSCCGMDTSGFASFADRTELRDAVHTISARENHQCFAETQQKYGPVKCWDVSQVTKMNSLFMYKTWGDLLGGDTLECWDVSSVTDMSYMFTFTEFTSSPNLSKWDVSSVTNMEQMLGYTSFEGDVSQWDVSSVTDMSSLFAGALSLNLDIVNWDVSSVQSMDNMFGQNSNFQSDLCPWASRVQQNVDVTDMFKGTNCPVKSDPQLDTGTPWCFPCM